jgi:hypothetical protein
MHNEMMLQHLSDVYEIWLDREEITEPYKFLGADELLYERAAYLTPNQLKWLNSFISLWEKIQN